MNIKSVVPVLYAESIERSLSYYVDVLGFDQKWEWGSPPTFGGVCKNLAEIFFCKQGQGNPGTWICIQIDDIEIYHKEISARGAKILSAPKSMEWGIREMLVEDPDGHRLRIGQHIPATDASPDSNNPTRFELKAGPFGIVPKTVQIMSRKPTAREFSEVLHPVGYTGPDVKQAFEQTLSAAIHGIVAEDSETGRAVGCVLLMGDWSGFCYVKDMIVHPEWRGAGIGSAMMAALSHWMDAHLHKGTTVWLHTNEGLARFYGHYGFVPAFGMYKTI